ncbi:M28 family peptidase [Marinigracilibium pacificum]|uniref:M28 family peptidase n=1 Tax=Marinigracilibium pacificum TaxID=2729599 RepID=A0A848J9U5_9BACT|nr:M28 family peptidase [Marinigracilibium pacificum]NMM49812.1 M28 family peptidase [Marinigracilibium pacificum]
MNNKIFYYLRGISLLAFIIILTNSCDTKSGSSEVTREEISNIYVPEFNSDSAFSFVENQVGFGPRVPGSEAHARCLEYLDGKLTEFGAKVTRQKFSASNNAGESFSFTNIIGVFNPNAQKRILLAAHWDTRIFADKDSTRQAEPIDGANDGASGVAVLLEVARQIVADSLGNVGVDIIFFDAEDNGAASQNLQLIESGKLFPNWCLGSRYWAQNPHKPNYSAYYGILLDMVGAKNAKFHYELYSKEYAPRILRHVWNIGKELGYSQFFIDRDGAPIEDDHVPIIEHRRFPMIDIIDFDQNLTFGDYHHTHKDNIDVISKETLKAVGQTVLTVIYRE